MEGTMAARLSRKAARRHDTVTSEVKCNSCEAESLIVTEATKMQDGTSSQGNSDNETTSTTRQNCDEPEHKIELLTEGEPRDCPRASRDNSERMTTSDELPTLQKNSYSPPADRELIENEVVSLPISANDYPAITSLSPSSVHQILPQTSNQQKMEIREPTQLRSEEVFIAPTPSFFGERSNVLPQTSQPYYPLSEPTLGRNIEQRQLMPLPMETELLNDIMPREGSACFFHDHPYHRRPQSEGVPALLFRTDTLSYAISVNGVFHVFFERGN